MVVTFGQERERLFVQHVPRDSLVQSSAEDAHGYSTEGEGLRKKTFALKALVRKLINARGLATVNTFGVTRTRSGFQRSAPMGEEEKAFVGRVFSSRQVLRQILRVLRPVAIAASTPEMTSMEVAKLALHAIHGAKLSAMRSAWRTVVAPLRAEVDDTRRKHAALLEQFQTVRAAYLKEVAMLRDESRVRGDPESALQGAGKTLDVTAFFDPMCTLLPHELDFAMRVASEKLKMVFETNPSITSSLDFGQIERLQHLCANHEAASLRQALERRTAEVEELRREQRTAMRSSAPRHTSKERNMIQALENRFTDLQQSYREQEARLQETRQRVLVLTQERDSAIQALAAAAPTKNGMQAAGSSAGAAGHDDAGLNAENKGLRLQCRALANECQRLHRLSVLQEGGEHVEHASNRKLSESWACEADSAFEASLDLAAQNANLEEECARLREALQEQARGLVVAEAEAQLQHAEALDKIANIFVTHGQVAPANSSRAEMGIETTSTSGVVDGDETQITHEPFCHVSTLPQLQETGFTASMSTSDVVAVGQVAGNGDTLGALCAQFSNYLAFEVGEQDSSWVARVSDMKQEISHVAEGKAVGQVTRFAQQLQSGLMRGGTPTEDKELDEVQSALGRLYKFTAYIADALKRQAAENVQLRELLASLHGEAGEAMQALRLSPHFKQDRQLQQCLERIQSVQSASEMCGVPPVFERLWKDSLQRRERSEKRRAERLAASLELRQPASSSMGTQILADLGVRDPFTLVEGEPLAWSGAVAGQEYEQEPRAPTQRSERRNVSSEDENGGSDGDDSAEPGRLKVRGLRPPTTVRGSPATVSAVDSSSPSPVVPQARRRALAGSTVRRPASAHEFRASTSPSPRLQQVLHLQRRPQATPSRARAAPRAAMHGTDLGTSSDVVPVRAVPSPPSQPRPLSSCKISRHWSSTKRRGSI